VSTTVGSGDGLLGGGGGLSGSSASSGTSSLIWIGGSVQAVTTGTFPLEAADVETEVCSGMPGTVGGVEVEGQDGGVMEGGPPGTKGC